MAASGVPFRIPGCRLGAVQADPSDLTVDASSKARGAVCPACGQRSRRVHDLCTRSPADLPVSDRAVGLRLPARLGGAGSDGFAARARHVHERRSPSHSRILKMLKRQMYGRAGFELLRKRVLCAA